MDIAMQKQRLKDVNWTDNGKTEFDPTKVLQFKPFKYGCIVCGGHFGDEGKGKKVDEMAEYYKSLGLKLLSARGQGSGNAGHTVKVNGIKYDFHYLTSAGLIADCMLLGPGMLIDPIRVLKEAEKLPTEKRKIIKISERAMIVTDAERTMDAWCENWRNHAGKAIIGTTKSGVGPGVGIRGIREHVTFADALACKDVNEFRSLYLKNYLLPKEAKDIFTEEYAEKLWDAIHRLTIVDSCELISKYRQEGDWAVLLEISQAIGLDPLFGNSGHFTTSTPCTNTGGVAFAGFTMEDFPEGSTIVFKGYASKVGGGPFNTKFTSEEEHIKKYIQGEVDEVGVTSGRERDLGWFDGVAARYAVSLTENANICINCMDVIGGMGKVTGEIKVCFAYKNIHTGEVVYNWPYHLKCYEPLYVSLSTVGKKEEEVIRDYIELLETVIGREITEYGVGPSREDFRKREDAFK